MKKVLATAAVLIAATLTPAATAGQRSDTAKNLNRGLQGTPMANTGYALEKAAYRKRISPYLIAAIAGTESSFGAAACRSNRYNAFGLSSCGTGWRVPNFQSWAEAYEFMAGFLTSRWPGATSPYSFRGYAACSDCWARKVAYWMRARFGVSERVAYP